MSEFKEVKNANVLVRTRSGLYRELPVYKYNKELYAKSGQGFYKLYDNRCTSSDSVKWSKINGVQYKSASKGGLTYLRLDK